MRDVVVAFIDRSHVESDENVASPAGFNGLTGSIAAAIGACRVWSTASRSSDPYNPKGISRTPSRALIFVCDPKAAEELSCARQITENLARRAFRRPVTAEDVNRLMPFYEAGRAGRRKLRSGNRAGGGGGAGQSRVPLSRDAGIPKGAHLPMREFALTDLELASRLSFFLWNTGPDEELLKLAAAGGLTKPGVLEKQVKRMLADPKASSLVTSFAMKWLNLADLDQVQPDPKLFPGFNEQLRRDFSTEAEDFISSILLEDRSVVDLLTANYTFLNDRLARHYGIPGVTGAQFRKVTLAEKERWGLLGKARGAAADFLWRPHLSGVARSVGARQADGHAADASSAGHRNRPFAEGRRDSRRRSGRGSSSTATRRVCRQCHGVIDPTGLPLENFDAIGQWRTVDREANAPIDASTVLPNGVPINGPVELSAQLAAAPRSVRAGRDGETDDVRPQPGAGIFRYAAGSRDRPRGGERQLQVVFHRFGNRQYATRSASRVQRPLRKPRRGSKSGAANVTIGAV